MGTEQQNLGRLEQIKDIRGVWKDEARDFTPWLAEEDNIKLLGDTIGVDLEVQSVEKSVGLFSADILCKDTATDSYVLIENQLEKTDHKHLGQLMTYAAGLEVVTIVWIADRFTDEHRAALDWLNDKTSDDLNFFGLEIELWRIGNSDIAPKFNLISNPNEWSHSIKDSAASVTSEELSKTKMLQLKFWTAFRNYMPSNSPIKITKPYAKHWLVLSIGRSGFTLFTIASTSPAEIRVYLNIKDKRYYTMLEDHKDEINNEIASPTEWKDGKNKKSNMIIVSQSADITNENHWPEQFEWLKEKLELFHRVFAHRIKALNADDYHDIPEGGEF